MLLQTTYRANGKLLLTGEYLVLQGAKAIALPLNLGQRMSVSYPENSDLLYWKAWYDGEIWFSCTLNPGDFSVIETSNSEKAETLSKMFRTIRSLNPEFSPKPGTQFETVLESNPEWGFGSSSTLVSLLSQYAGVDPFKLNELVFLGSGFDIACADAPGPVFYIRNNPSEPILLDYPFSANLVLVYSGQKKKTANEVSTFLKEKTVPGKHIEKMTALSDEFAGCRDQNEFNRLIVEHEKLVSNIIGQTPVKEIYFHDFAGAVKSLGAWGGDFYLVSSELPFSGVKEYFENKGLNTLFKWDDLILTRK